MAVFVLQAKKIRVYRSMFGHKHDNFCSHNRFKKKLDYLIVITLSGYIENSYASLCEFIRLSAPVQLI